MEVKVLIINDVHAGFHRAGGTTPASQEALRSYLLTRFEKLLVKTPETHTCIAGDLFDDFDVPIRDLLHVYMVLQAYLARGNSLTLVAGNHDHQPRGEKVSSFEMLAHVLDQQFPGNVTVIDIDQWDGNNEFIVLAHCSNQTIFDEKLAEVLEAVKMGMRVLLHANYDNNFAAASDHSLNVTSQQALAFAQKGATLIFAHEHQARTALGGSVVVLGNQWPTSINDCLRNEDKCAHILNGGLTKVPTWGRAGEAGYGEVDWRDVGVNAIGESVKFIRVVGEAEASEAAEVMNVISKLRTKSSAFVITNAVKIAGVADCAALPESFEATSKFEVMDFIEQHVEPEEFKVVMELSQ